MVRQSVAGSGISPEWSGETVMAVLIRALNFKQPRPNWRLLECTASTRAPVMPLSNLLGDYISRSERKED
jgi:hypothetical protein